MGNVGRRCAGGQLVPVLTAVHKYLASIVFRLPCKKSSIGGSMFRLELRTDVHECYYRYALLFFGKFQRHLGS